MPGAAALSVTPEVKEQQAAAIEAFYAGAGLLPRLRGRPAPLLLVGGAQDAVVPATTQVELADSLPAASLVQVPDAGHLVHFVRPQQYAALVAAWLDQAQVPGTACRRGCMRHAPARLRLPCRRRGALRAWPQLSLPACVPASVRAAHRRSTAGAFLQGRRSRKPRGRQQ